MRAQGAQRPAFDSIVAAGPHGALPHAQPRDVEVGARGAGRDRLGRRGRRLLLGLHAHGRGRRTDDEAREVYELVLAAQLAGVDAVHAGAGGREVDAAARTVIEAAGHGEHFGHGLGHGVGLEIHEAPRLSTRSDDELQSGNVVTVEPGVYLPGRLGVRIEDLVVVGDRGARS